jgi:CRISPR-associated endonuclease/helicase Cas3
MTYIAHVRKDEAGKPFKQSLMDHLDGVARHSKSNAGSISLPLAGELLGLLHDLGKYSKSFQTYLESATGIINQDEDEWVDAAGLKGKIDHSTAGAQFIWNFSKNLKPKDQIVAQILALCMVSHHSGLIDCITTEGKNNFERRINTLENHSHLSEVLEKADPELIEKATALLNNPDCFGSVLKSLKKIAIKEQSEKSIRTQFQAGLMVRMLFSSLIDADRLDTADFEKPADAKSRQYGTYKNWDVLIDRLEERLKGFDNKPGKNKIDELRTQIADSCLSRAADNPGVFTLTVPTGGGKTLASLRFALHHAKKHHLDRIIFVIPFTSIIDQNAQVVREILESDRKERGKIVLEHHSNLMPEIQNWKSKILTENWDAPIIYTTNVQLLETLFGSGTRGARRMHQLANAVIVFDEIQTLPIKTIHMFCNAVNYLKGHCHSSVVLCTATQPLLNKVSEEKGRIAFNEQNELMPDVQQLFADLKRVEVIDQTKPGGWENDEIASLAIKETTESGSCLIVVNTKKSAQQIYEACSTSGQYRVYHLSTSMCPAHRMEKLNEIRSKLGNEPLICVSTQLIEAGVDIDFGSVIRFLAGLDSVAQAAGRCNRNGNRVIGKVHVVNPASETIDSLQDIKRGRDVAVRVLHELNLKDSSFSDEVINPTTMDRYYQYYFFNCAEDMSYSVDVGRNDSLLDLLSINEKSVAEHSRIKGKWPDIYFRQCFMEAAKAFKSIDAPTRGVVVPHGKEGQKLVADLFSAFAIERQFELLRKAQRFTVNVFPNVLENLQKDGALRQVKDIEVMVLDTRYYHPELGLSTVPLNEMDLLNT